MKKYKPVFNFKEGDYYSLDKKSDTYKKVNNLRNEILTLIKNVEKLGVTLFNLNNNFLNIEEKYRDDMSSVKDFENLAKNLEKEFNIAKSEIPKIIKLLYSYKKM